MIRVNKPFDFRRFAPLGLMIFAVGFALYPVAISPMIDASEYKEMQKVTRKGIKQENIQPGDMKVWSDPFDRNKD